MKTIDFILPLVLAVHLLQTGLKQNQSNVAPQFELPAVKYEIYSPTIPTIKEGFICRAEDAIYKHSKMAVTFRLGNLQYVNRLDRK